MKRFAGFFLIIFTLLACEVTETPTFSLEFDSNLTTVARGEAVTLSWKVIGAQKAESGAYASTGCVLSELRAGQSAELTPVACNEAAKTVSLTEDTTFSLIALKTLPDVTDSKTISVKIAEGNTSPPVPPVDPDPSVNIPPFVENDAYSVVRGATLVVSAAEGVLANDEDKDGDTLTVRLLSPVSHGTLTLQPDGGFSYVHDGGSSPIDSFSYVASDGKADSPSATASISITEPSATNRAPVATEDAYAFDSGETLNIPAAVGVLANDTDADGDSLNASLVSSTQHGTLSLASDGSFSYVHDGSTNLADSFSYQAKDTQAAVSAIVSVTLQADAPPTPPTLPTILSRQISSTNDDTEQLDDDTSFPTGTMVPTSPDLDIGTDVGGKKTVGLRFTDISIAKGTVIKKAYIQFTTDVEEASSGSPSIDVYLVDSANPAAFSINDFSIDALVWTKVSTWTPAPWLVGGARGPAQQLDTTALVQQAVNRADWAEGNALAVILNTVNDGVRIADSFDGNPEGAATLIIEY